MDIVAQAQVDSPFSFNFYPCTRAGNPLIRAEQVFAGYDANRPILKKMNLVLKSWRQNCFAWSKWRR